MIGPKSGRRTALHIGTSAAAATRSTTRPTTTAALRLASPPQNAKFVARNTVRPSVMTSNSMPGRNQPVPPSDGMRMRRVRVVITQHTRKSPQPVTRRAQPQRAQLRRRVPNAAQRWQKQQVILGTAARSLKIQLVTAQA